METAAVKNCKTLASVSVGDRIYLRPLGNAARSRNSAGFYATVTKIARKYFYAETDGGFEYKFPIDGGEFYDYDQNYGYLPYPSKEAFDDDTETDRQFNVVRKYFSHTYRVDISREAIREIYALLEKEGVLKEDL